MLMCCITYRHGKGDSGGEVRMVKEELPPEGKGQMIPGDGSGALISTCLLWSLSLSVSWPLLTGPCPYPHQPQEILVYE